MSFYPNVPAAASELLQRIESAEAVYLDFSRLSADILHRCEKLSFVCFLGIDAHSYVGIELQGKTLGVVGLGPIGVRLTQLAIGIGMEVMAWTRHPSRQRSIQPGVRLVSLQDLFSHSDVISLNIPGREDTRGFIGRELLELVKPSAILVNTARSEIVDNEALVDLLRQKPAGRRRY